MGPWVGWNGQGEIVLLEVRLLVETTMTSG